MEKVITKNFYHFEEFYPFASIEQSRDSSLSPFFVYTLSVNLLLTLFAAYKFRGCFDIRETLHPGSWDSGGSRGARCCINLFVTVRKRSRGPAKQFPMIHEDDIATLFSVRFSRHIHADMFKIIMMLERAAVNVSSSILVGFTSSFPATTGSYRLRWAIFQFLNIHSDEFISKFFISTNNLQCLDKWFFRNNVAWNII